MTATQAASSRLDGLLLVHGFGSWARLRAAGEPSEALAHETAKQPAGPLVDLLEGGSGSSIGHTARHTR
jgi:hypothetical protein